MIDMKTARGLMLVLFAVVLFTVEDVTVKDLGARLGVFQILALTSAASLALFAPVIPFVGLDKLKLQRPLLFLYRTLVGLGASLALYYALPRMALAQSNALVHLETLFIFPIAALLLGERFTLRRFAATLVGFAGAMVMLRPSADIAMLPAAVAVLSAFLYAMKAALLKKIAATEGRFASVFWISAIGLLIAGVAAPFDWSPVAVGDLGLIGLKTVAGLVTFWLFIEAYRLADATALAPAFHAGIPAAVIAGWLVFDEVLAAGDWIGIALILLATIIPSLKIVSAVGGARADTK